MARLIDSHAREYPAGDWTPFRQIDYDHEVQRLKYVWFPRAICAQPPALVPVAGLWFGLFERTQITPTGTETLADFYISGTKEFSIDGNANWASVPIWSPDDDCANSNVLANIRRLALAGDKGLGDSPQQFLSVGFVAAAITEMLRENETDSARIVRADQTVGIGVGWNSGDPFYIGHITTRGIQLRPPAEAIAGIQRRHEEFERRFHARLGSKGSKRIIDGKPRSGEMK